MPLKWHTQSKTNLNILKMILSPRHPHTNTAVVPYGTILDITSFNAKHIFSKYVIF